MAGGGGVRGGREEGREGGSPPAEEPAGALPGLPPILCVVGKKDQGKTGLVVALASELRDRGRRVMTVKHGRHFDLDRPGTDSWRHRHEGGAERVVLAGPEEFAVLGEWGPEGERELVGLVARHLSDAEIVLAEGYKEARLPKVEIFRRESGATPVYAPDAPDAPFYVALVTDRTDLSADLPLLHPDDPGLARVLADLVEGVLLEKES